jgi:hypothetical protein
MDVHHYERNTMSENYPTFPGHAPFQQAPAPKLKSKWRFALPVGLLVGGIIIGSAAAGSAEPKTVEVTKEVPGPERIVEKKVEVRVVPAACTEYITLSEKAFDYSAEAMGYMSDALQAAGRFDTAAISTASEKLKVLNPKMSALTTPVNTAKGECRASAK